MVPDPKILLEMENWSLFRRHAGQELTLLDNIDLRITAGRWLAVLGANGSGKSSLLKFLASEESPLDLESAIMFQDPDDQIIASTLSRELTLGREGLDPDPVLMEFGLAGLNDLDPRLLSAGQKQRLVMAVTEAGSPRIMLADEPTALQDPEQAAWVLARLRKWLEEPGRTLITATCDRREAALADDLLVLEKGRVVLQGPTRDVLDDPRVSGLLGEGFAVSSPPVASASSSEPVLDIQDLTCRFHQPGSGFHLKKLSVGPGERLGITGGNGCGKSTLLAACTGARKPEAGRIILRGRSLYGGKNLDLDHGLAMLAPQFPEYLFTRETVAREIAVDPVLQSRSAGEFLVRMGLDVTFTSRNPHSLSSGQKRRLALGLVLFSERPLLLLDEPTAALDHSGRQMVLDLLSDLNPEAALVIASHDRGFLAAAGCSVLNLDDHSLRP
jgi:energy-coupling factor transport system ATP-binding protein